LGIRETLNKNPGITTGVTAGIVVAAIGVIVWQLWGGSGPGASGGGVGKQFYSDDDGATYFVDSSTKVPPFDHNGKKAVRALVFQCGDGKPFVGMLQRYTPDAKAKVEKIQSGAKPGDVVMEDIEITGLEVKKPKTGDTGWVKQTDPKAGAINRVTCPDGKVDKLTAVSPD
jgi:hypothetical protein